MLRPNGGREASVLPGMVQMKVGISAAGVVSYPAIILMDMRGLGMAGLIVASSPAFLRWRRTAVYRSTITVSRHLATFGRTPLTSWRVRRADLSRTARGSLSLAYHM